MAVHANTSLHRAAALVVLGVAACITSAIAQPQGNQAATRYPAVQQGAGASKLGAVGEAAKSTVPDGCRELLRSGPDSR